MLVLCQELERGIFELKLNRPDKRNALNIELLESFCKELEALKNTARVIILRGEGSLFCAGLDLAEARDSSKAQQSAKLVAQALERIFYHPSVTIAALHGAAIAGGAGLMSACDFAYAEPKTKIGYPEVRRGLVAGLVMTFLRRQIGERAARELLLLGNFIEAPQAALIGLINAVVTDPFEKALETAQVALEGAPKAIQMTKNLLNTLYHSDLASDFAHAEKVHMEARKSSEASEGTLAFLEKRKPQWQA